MCLNIMEKKQQILLCLSTLFVFFLFSTVLLFCFLKNNDKFSSNKKEQRSSVWKDFMWSKKRNCPRMLFEDFTGSNKRNAPQTLYVDFIRSKKRNIPQIQYVALRWNEKEERSSVDIPRFPLKSGPFSHKMQSFYFKWTEERFSMLHNLLKRIRGMFLI